VARNIRSGAAGVPRTADLATQDRQLMAEDGDLHVLVVPLPDPARTDDQSAGRWRQAVYLRRQRGASSGGLITKGVSRPSHRRPSVDDRTRWSLDRAVAWLGAAAPGCLVLRVRGLVRRLTGTRAIRCEGSASRWGVTALSELSYLASDVAEDAADPTVGRQ